MNTVHSAREVLCMIESLATRVSVDSVAHPKPMDGFSGLKCMQSALFTQVVGNIVDRHLAKATVNICIFEVLGTEVESNASLMAAGIDSLGATEV